MANFGKRSKANLSTADTKLQTLFNEVIKYFDCSVICGHRSKEEQLKLYKNGRELIAGKWAVKNKQKIVTNCDGVTTLSAHNSIPSKAVDVVPYPIDWKDTNRMYMFVGFVLGIAKGLNIEVVSGADWDGDTDLNDQHLHDLVHFQLI